MTMTNLETLEDFNEIVKPYLEKHPNIELLDLLYRVEYYSLEKNGVPLLMQNDIMAIWTIEEYLKSIAKDDNDNDQL